MDWQSWKEKVAQELIRVTKPGGYIEIMDINGESINPGISSRKIDDHCKYLMIVCYAYVCIFEWVAYLANPLLLKL